MSAPLTVRPVPIQDAFRSVGGALDFAGSLVVLLAGYGVVTAVQGSALVALLGTVPGLISLVGDVVRAFQVRRAVAEAEAAVTPLSDPAELVVVDGVEVLVPLVRDPARDPYSEV
jgi:hypothetical protein